MSKVLFIKKCFLNFYCALNYVFIYLKKSEMYDQNQDMPTIWEFLNAVKIEQ